MARFREGGTARWLGGSRRRGERCLRAIALARTACSELMLGVDNCWPTTRYLAPPWQALILAGYCMAHGEPQDQDW